MNARMTDLSSIACLPSDDFDPRTIAGAGEESDHDPHFEIQSSIRHEVCRAKHSIERSGLKCVEQVRAVEFTIKL